MNEFSIPTDHFLTNNHLVELQDIIRFNKRFIIDAANEHDAAEKEQLLREWTQEPFPDMFNKWCIVCFYRDYEMYPLPASMYYKKTTNTVNTIGLWYVKFFKLNLQII